MMSNNTVMNTSGTAGFQARWRIVRFVRPHSVSWGSLASGSYAAGETAGFPPEIAARIVDTGAALYIDDGAPLQRPRMK
ncbi:hypothetical protein GAY31_18845 [Azospirillum brasilense]|nr:hypothetical protein [Azospirillum brasilense]